MAEEFLHRLGILTIGVEEYRIGAPRGVPANSFDSELLGCWKNMRLVECGIAKTQSSDTGHGLARRQL